MPQDKKKQFPEPDNFTVAFRDAMRKLRRDEVEEHIRKSPDAPKLNLPKVMNGQPNPDSIIDEGEVRRRADLIVADMELEKHNNIAKSAAKFNRVKPKRK